MTGDKDPISVFCQSTFGFAVAEINITPDRLERYMV